MTWTGQTFSVGQQLTAAQMNNLQADITALANGDTGSPEITNAALAATAVSQGVMDVGTSSSSVTHGTSVALSGGQFSLFVQTANNTGYGSSMGLYNGASTTYGTYISASGSGGSGKGRNTYINASPPFNNGYGDIGVFVWARINNTTKQVDMFQISQAPPWAYNGPTSLRPTRIDRLTRKKYKQVIQRTVTLEEALLSPAKMEIYKAELESPKFIEVEIDMEMKNKDMPLIPHPMFGNDNTGYTIVVLDPFCHCAQILQNLIELNDDAALDEADKLIEQHIQFDNIPLNAGFHGSVMCVNGDIV